MWLGTRIRTKTNRVRAYLPTNKINDLCEWWYLNRTISHQHLYPFRIESLRERGALFEGRRAVPKRGRRPQRAGRGQAATERKHLTDIKSR